MIESTDQFTIIDQKIPTWLPLFELFALLITICILASCQAQPYPVPA